MGIPSYYKKLVSTIPGLVSPLIGINTDNEQLIHWLFMDFNCLIYHCLHRSDIPPYPGDSGKTEWEEIFLNGIVKYCLKVIEYVNPINGVFIAIDGVVPMAKMKQQRIRRFKSIWLSQQVDTNDINVWDKNSITPGTLFMKKLHTRLNQMIVDNNTKCTNNCKLFLSSSDEPGEGEHKIISEWRKGTYNGNFAIYGLDADLIVLSILGRELCGLDNKINLFREEIESGKIVYNSCGEEQFEWFSINALTNWLISDCNNIAHNRSFILNYCFTMSVLGNDFLPTSLGLKIRENGHSIILNLVSKFTSDGVVIVDPDTLELSVNGIKELFSQLSSTENISIQKYINKKQMFAKNVINETDIGVGHNDFPLLHIEEGILIDGKHLCTDWEEKYFTHLCNGCSYNKVNIEKMCSEYLYGIQWIWAYYTGMTNKVCFNWFYSFNLPPLWKWLRDYLSINSLPTFPNNILIGANDIKPIEQLVLVLPLESWNLIPECYEKILPQIAPQFYPSAFSFESVGKRFFWECESLIPLPSIIEIKEIIKHHKALAPLTS